MPKINFEYSNLSTVAKIYSASADNERNTIHFVRGMSDIDTQRTVSYVVLNLYYICGTQPSRMIAFYNAVDLLNLLHIFSLLVVVGLV